MVRLLTVLASTVAIIVVVMAFLILKSQVPLSPLVTEVVKPESLTNGRQHGNNATGSSEKKIKATGSGSKWSSLTFEGRTVSSKNTSINRRPDEAGFASLRVTSKREMSPRDVDKSMWNETVPTEVAWCILDANNTYRFQHFAHASQSLFPCWSYFERMREKIPNLICGYWFRGWTPGKSRYMWQSDLMTAMGCIQTKTPPQFAQQHFHRIELVGGFVTQVGYRTIPDIHWFDRPHHAWTLRDTVLQSSNLTVSPRPRPIRKKVDQLRIGLIRRIKRKKRVIVNIDEIATALQIAFPEAVITNATLEWMKLGEQAYYFASNDIIIAAHGAAMINCAFLQPGSIVVQLYPKHYYPTFFFEPLIRQVKSYPYAWYEGYPMDPLRDHIMHPNTIEHRFVDLTPPANEIVDIVRNATREKKLYRNKSKKTF